MKYILTFLAILVFSLMMQPQLSAQKLNASELAQFKEHEVALIKLVDSMRNSYLSDEKLETSYEFITKLKSVLKTNNSYQYPFDSLRRLMHIIDAPDKSFRIFNWVVTTSNVNKVYFGTIQLPNNTMIPLIDYSTQLEETKNIYAITSNKEWFGGEYYNIQKDQHQGKDVYLLYGFNSGDAKTNKKFIDVLTIEGTTAKFGAPIFNAPDNLGNVQLRNRFIQYYKKGVTTSLNWDAQLGAIVFNRLESDISTPSRFDTYVPAGAIDALKKEGGQWNYHPQVLQILKLSDGKAPIDGVMK